VFTPIATPLRRFGNGSGAYRGTLTDGSRCGEFFPMRLISIIAVAAVSTPPSARTIPKSRGWCMTRSAGGWASSGALQDTLIAASNKPARRRHERAYPPGQTAGRFLPGEPSSCIELCRLI
jgi:hypothetical protein